MLDYSYQDHIYIFILKEIEHKIMASNRKANLAFPDLENAFDKVLLVQIWKILPDNIGKYLEREDS